MQLLKAFCIAFSIFSKIPMPQFEWKEKDMKYMLIFFPFVGAIVGLVEFGWIMLCAAFGINFLTQTFGYIAIVLLITGGFHVDGFMDMSDALHSYKPKEEKLLILSDPHIGAFSVIALCTLGLLYAASLANVTSRYIFVILSIGFVTSRIYSAIAIICFKNAKEGGMVSTFKDDASKKTVLVVLIIELVAANALAFSFSVIATIVLIAANVLTLLFYKLYTKKQLGGITGDTAGWFVCICEVVTTLALSIIGMVL